MDTMWVFCGGLPLRGAECTRSSMLLLILYKHPLPFYFWTRWTGPILFIHSACFQFSAVRNGAITNIHVQVCVWKCLNSSLKLGVECYECTFKFPSAMLSQKIKFTKQPYHLAIVTEGEENQIDSWPCCRPAPLELWILSERTRVCSASLDGVRDVDHWQALD